MVCARTARQDRPLQMQYAIADLLGTALIPELRTDIAARTTGDVQRLLVAVAAMRRQDRPLQMQYAIADLLGTALIPELRTDIAARTTGDVQRLLVAVAAMRTLPHQLAVILHNLDLAVEAASTRSRISSVRP